MALLIRGCEVVEHCSAHGRDQKESRKLQKKERSGKRWLGELGMKMTVVVVAEFPVLAAMLAGFVA